MLVCILLGPVTRAGAQSTNSNAPSTNAPVTPPVLPTAPEDSTVPYKKLSLEQLMNLDVTSVARQPEPYGEAAAAIDVITGDEIRRSGATSIPEALRLADNLDVAQVRSASWDISARGFNSSVSDKLQVLIDGRSVYTPLLAGVLWNQQDYLLEDLDRIEVISGPGGTMWGANAVNGVINITTKSAQDTQGLYLESGGGTEYEDFAGMRYGATLASNVYFRVYGKYFEDGPEVYADGTTAHDGWNQGQGGFRLDAMPNGPDRFTVSGDLLVGDLDLQPGGEGTPVFEGTSSGGDILGRWTHVFADDADMSLQTYYNQTHLAVPFQSADLFGKPIPAGSLFENLYTYDVDFQDRFPVGSWNNVIWGMGYQFTHDIIQAAPLVAFEPNPFDRNLFSGFLQDKIKLTDGLFLTLGSKLEHNDYTGFEYEPSARLQWNITDKQMVWGAVSRAVRMPARYDVDLFEPSPGYGTFLGTSNSPFMSENVIAYELGYRAQVLPKVTTSLSLFYNHYDDLRSLSYTPVTLVPLYYANNNEGNTYGFELTADYQALSWWRLHGGYDLLKEDIFVKPGYVDLDDSINETADPQQQAFLRSSMDLPYGLELDEEFRFIDVVHNNNGGVPGRIPAYGELDARLGWHATKHLELAIVGQNLLHDQHAEAGFAGPTQEQIARSVYLKAALRW